MGNIFNAWHIRLASSLSDLNISTGAVIDSAEENGKLRSSAQRNRALMDGRYFVHSILRLIDKEQYHVIQTGIAPDVSGFLDVSTYNIINHNDLEIVDLSSNYGKPISLLKGNEVGIYHRLLATSKKSDIVAVIAGQNTTTPSTIRLRFLKGSNILAAYTGLSLDIGYYSIPILYELHGTTAATQAGTGTIGTSGSSTTITGSGTAFTTELEIGSVLSPGGTVTAIASDTSLTVSSAVNISGGTSFTFAYADPTEPRIWHPIIESYALVQCWNQTTNLQRGAEEWSRLKMLVQSLVQNDFGAGAGQRVSQYLEGAR